MEPTLMASELVLPGPAALGGRIPTTRSAASPAHTTSLTMPASESCSTNSGSDFCLTTTSMVSAETPESAKRSAFISLWLRDLRPPGLPSRRRRACLSASDIRKGCPPAESFFIRDDELADLRRVSGGRFHFFTLPGTSPPSSSSLIGESSGTTVTTSGSAGDSDASVRSRGIVIARPRNGREICEVRHPSTCSCLPSSSRSSSTTPHTGHDGTLREPLLPTPCIIFLPAGGTREPRRSHAPITPAPLARRCSLLGPRPSGQNTNLLCRDSRSQSPHHPLYHSATSHAACLQGPEASARLIPEANRPRRADRS
mmetsp:Transcript_33299/g.106236  ORF Transcript_33299/g.106236 Transcript_33299/m.106236 type:complete len:313 (-) Transcript_33299:46-984(-)